MGNRALRKQLRDTLKAAGFNVKVYHGNKNIAYRGLTASYLRDLIELYSLKPGDLVSDVCGGFNKRVKGFVHPPYHWWEGRNTEKIGHETQVEFEDGTYSCGCNPPIKGRTREELEQAELAFIQEKLEVIKEDGSIELDAISVARDNALKAGRHICDEDGVLLPEFEALDLHVDTLVRLPDDE